MTGQETTQTGTKVPNGLTATDARMIEVWREHGIPLDHTTVNTALDIIGKLQAELVEAWGIVDELTSRIQPTLWENQ